MKLELEDFAAFVLNGRGGNRASVVFGLDLHSEQRLRDLAASTNAPATVFVGVSERLFDLQAPLPVRLRFFTPEIEESVCGHGTVAALVALQARGGLNGWRVPEGIFEIETPLGLQRVMLEGDLAWLEYPQPFAQKLEDSVADLRQDLAFALGLELDDLHEDLPVMLAGVGRPKLVCAVPSTVLLDAIEPDLERIAVLCRANGATGVVAFTFPGRAGCFTDSRHFSLQRSVVEDAATGNAHVALVAYLVQNNFFDAGAQRFSGAQGFALGQPSRLELRFRVLDAEAKDVWVGGQAVPLKVEGSVGES